MKLNQMIQLTALFMLLLAAYTLPAQTVGEEELGLASYYSDDFQGRKTSYGETYDRNQLTAAHKRFPYNSRIRVTRLDNGKSVIVRVIDQGPYIRGRVVDLSRRAAEQLDLINDATAEVRVVLLELPTGSPVAATPTTTPATARMTEPATGVSSPRQVETTSTTPDNRAQQPTTPAAQQPAPSSPAASTPSTTKTSSSTTTTRPPAQNEPKMYTKGDLTDGVYKIEIRRAPAGDWGVQVASLNNYEGALRQIAKLQARWFENILMKQESTGNTKSFKIILGPFESEAVAQRYEKDLLKRYKIKGFTVQLNPPARP